jgi:tetratricopeptide (TPR) repeat protein
MEALLRGWLPRCSDRIEEAWAVALPAEERLHEFGDTTSKGWLAEIALIAGDHEAAAGHLRDACDAFELSGNTGLLSTYVSKLARVLCALGRYDEAQQCARQGRELGAPEDVMTQQYWRQAQALVESARGQHRQALRLAQEAVGLSRQGDSPLEQGNALTDLAQVLEAADRTTGAAATLREALECYEHKQIIPLARRTREKLAALETQSSGM